MTLFWMTGPRMEVLSLFNIELDPSSSYCFSFSRLSLWTFLLGCPSEPHALLFRLRFLTSGFLWRSMLEVANLEISAAGIFWILFASSRVKSCGCSKLRKFKKFAITEASLYHAVTTDHSKCHILFIVYYIISRCRTSWLALHVVFTRCQLHQLLGTSCISIPLLRRNT